MSHKSFNGIDCLAVTSGYLEALVTLDIGPRIISLTYKEGENLFFTFPNDFSRTGSADYLHYGGHRLWTTPESLEYTYHPENVPVSVSDEWLSSSPDSRGIQKSFRLKGIPEGFLLEHKLTNVGENIIETSPWGITMLKGRGFAIFPNEPKVTHGSTSFLPVRTLSLWSYTKMNDSRLTFTDHVTQISHSATAESFKIGAFVSKGWGAYVVDGLVFHKTFVGRPDNYPDRGVNFEIYTDSNLLETETTGTVRKLSPGESVINSEIWQVFPASDSLLDDCESKAELVRHLIN